MSFNSASASTEADEESGSSNNPLSLPSTSGRASSQPSARQNISKSSHYPTELSTNPSKPRPTETDRLETFEDLLREAGYTHTRVVTPRTERLAKDAATYSSHREEDESRSRTLSDSTASGYVAKLASILSWISTRSNTASTALPAGPSNDRSPDSLQQHEAGSTLQNDAAEEVTNPQLHRDMRSARPLRPRLNRASSSGVTSAIGHVSKIPYSYIPKLANYSLHFHALTFTCNHHFGLLPHPSLSLLHVIQMETSLSQVQLPK
ncbi:hypothetical protein CPB86DRAFT_173258 [Serendipita vermifera]|nr:hypothetical protein CPB86DRAFT_173258 [Serendipita vermifera]